MNGKRANPHSVPSLRVNKHFPNTGKQESNIMLVYGLQIIGERNPNQMIEFLFWRLCHRPRY